jgi:hypothetical protein
MKKKQEETKKQEPQKNQEINIYDNPDIVSLAKRFSGGESFYHPMIKKTIQDPVITDFIFYMNQLNYK